ncbi:MAG: hypothetical protein Q7S98_01365 [Deltaproteobacteria bacterium]|nr:hypothetical protein [Deltaproteobacteria bacterium]
MAGNGASPVSASRPPYIVIEADAADHLEDTLDGSDIPICEAIEGDNYKLEGRTTRTFWDSPKAPEYEWEIWPDDRNITLTELRRSFLATYRTPQSQAVADRVFGQLKSELGDTIGKNEIDRFQQILTDQAVHLDAGGIIINNNIDSGGNLAIKLKKPGLTRESIRARVLPYDTYKTMPDLELTFEVPVPGEPNAYYEFTITRPDGVAGKVVGMFPAVTKLVFPQNGGNVVAHWDMVSHPEAQRLIDQFKPDLARAMSRAGITTNLDEYADTFKKELTSVRNVFGSVSYDPQTGIFIYQQSAQVSWKPPSDSFIIRPLLQVALHYAGDPRAEAKAKIPCWMSEDDGPMEKDFFYAPAFK